MDGIVAKTFKNLYPIIYDFENLLAAYERARKGKRNRPAVKRFHYNLESNLIDIQNHLIWGTWRTGQYRPFTLYEPVYRTGAALPFRDRVLHHSLVYAIEPCFGPRMIADTYACIENRGTHRGADKVQAMLRKVQREHGQAYVFKADISKYFRNINHEILRKIIRQRVGCQQTLHLLDEIIGSSAEPGDLNPVGIPLGNLTSQLFANIYLGELDLYVKHTLRIKHYARYMDDFCIIHHDKRYLHAVRDIIETFLWSQLGLLTNQKTQVFPVALRSGRALDFLGYRIWPTHRRLRKSSIRRMVRRMRQMQKAYAVGDIDLDDIRPTVHSWLAHAQHAETLGLRRHILARFPFMRDDIRRLDEPPEGDYSDHEPAAIGLRDPALLLVD